MIERERIAEARKAAYKAARETNPHASRSARRTAEHRVSDIGVKGIVLPREWTTAKIRVGPGGKVQVGFSAKEAAKILKARKSNPSPEFRSGEAFGRKSCRATNGIFLSGQALEDAYRARFANWSATGQSEFLSGYRIGFWYAYDRRSARRSARNKPKRNPQTNIRAGNPKCRRCGGTRRVPCPACERTGYVSRACIHCGGLGGADCPDCMERERKRKPKRNPNKPTLTQWLRQLGADAHEAIRNVPGLVGIHDVRAIEPIRWELWNLADYRVESAQAGVIWLARRRGTNPGPPGSAFRRCVKSVSARGGAYDPRAVCAAAGRRKYGAKRYREMAAAGRRRASAASRATARRKR
jgi:hypothetical protein